MLEASGDGFSGFVEFGGGKGDDAETRSTQCETGDGFPQPTPPIGLGPRWVTMSRVKSLTQCSPERHHGVSYNVVKGETSEFRRFRSVPG